MVATITEHIQITPGVCGGKPRIAGHRIRVQDVVIWHEEMGLSPQAIVAEHTTITLADIYAALAYYHDHLDEIRAQMAAGEALADSLRSQLPSKVQQKLQAQCGEN
ncbi:DUF433 domain-containing protein [Spirulina major]|uniref:DUF433 domain-containing protein n=1 Tax=Spirulina major TaxID=270636 RepID=UPI000932E1EE|nr:DUF433 domain-containing protein [Spirulina major]